MTFYGAKELAESFRTVRENTVQVAKDIPDDKYSFEAAPGTRTVEKLLTHIALSTGFQSQFHTTRRTNMDGLDFSVLFEQIKAEEEKPRNKEHVIELLKREGDSWANLVAGLTDEFLGDIVEMPKGATPPKKSRFEMILSVKEHEMHHRGQLMLVERIIGIVPHLTRRMEERWAQMQAQAAQSRAR
jgi:uncharacterized damage-inducible protein DinB